MYHSLRTNETMPSTRERGTSEQEHRKSQAVNSIVTNTRRKWVPWTKKKSEVWIEAHKKTKKKNFNKTESGSWHHLHLKAGLIAEEELLETGGPQPQWGWWLAIPEASAETGQWRRGVYVEDYTDWWWVQKTLSSYKRDQSAGSHFGDRPDKPETRTASSFSQQLPAVHRPREIAWTVASPVRLLGAGLLSLSTTPP